jgi:hypothetical protein
MKLAKPMENYQYIDVKVKEGEPASEECFPPKDDINS